MNADNAWAEMACELLEHTPITDNKGRSFTRIPGWMLVFDGFPLVTLRRVAWRNALREWQWLLGGTGLIADLHPNVAHWWSRWGKNGKVEGVGVKGVEDFLTHINTAPYSRRHILTTFGEPCEVPRNDLVIQATVGGAILDLFVYQRTASLVTGMPHNWVQLWAFGLWVAKHCGLGLGEMRWVAGDVHLPEEHREVALKSFNAASTDAPELVYVPPIALPFRESDFALTGPYSPTVLDPVEYV